jgi:hypothetical protein
MTAKAFDADAGAIMRSLSNRLVATMRRAVEWGDRRVSTGLRSVVGGVLGFLPLLWMLPIGLAFIALDIPPLKGPAVRNRWGLFFRCLPSGLSRIKRNS